MSAVLQKHSRMPRKLSKLTLRRREQQAIGGVHSLSQVEPKAVVQRYIAGEKIRDMATQYGVSDIALYAFLLRHVPEDWKAAKLAKAHSMKDGGEEDLDQSPDPLSVAIAREKIRAGQWDLERLDRKTYGRDEAQININVFDLGDRLRRARDRTQTIDVTEGSAASVEVRAGAEPGLAVPLGASLNDRGDVLVQQSAAQTVLNPTQELVSHSLSSVDGAKTCA